MSIQHNLEQLRARIPQNVRLVVVSKYATLEQMKTAYDCGVRNFGESKVQDVQAKFKMLPEAMVQSCHWHFAGHLQQNKAKPALQLGFSLIHSVDSLALAQKLSQQAQALGKTQAVLLQVNITQAPSQFGFAKKHLLDIFPQLMTLPCLDIQGLMAIGPHVHEDGAASRDAFSGVARLRDTLQKDFDHPLPELSMGMSEDFEHALQCGATILRIGNRVFGIT